MDTQTKNTNIRDIIGRLDIFQECNATFLDTLAQQSKTQHLKKGQVLIVHEDKAKRFYIISKGLVKLYRETLNGTQAVIDITAKNNIFGETSIFHNNTHPYSAEATENSIIISCPLPLLKTEIENNPKLAIVMLSSMAKLKHETDQELEHRTIQNASQRIGCLLLKIANQNSKKSTSISLPYDKALIASRLGMQPETFSRALKKLKKETKIEIKGTTVTVDNISQLSQYSCIACSSEFPCKDL